MTKLNKVTIEVKKENQPTQLTFTTGVNIDKRTLNTGRPVNKKSARQARLAKQAFYANVNSKFKKGSQFKINDNTYAYSASKSGGCIINEIGGYVCNVDYIGRTKVQGYTFVLGKRVNVELNLKTLKFVK